MAQEYEMTDAQLDVLAELSKPMPFAFMTKTRVDRGWKSLGAEMGFDWETVTPINGACERHFMAEPTGNSADERNDHD